MILYVAALTALRIGEITALKVTDLDFKSTAIHIRASLDYLTREESVPKTKKSANTVPMQESLERALREYLPVQFKPNPQGYLFVNRFGRPHKSEKVVQYGVHKTMDKLGIPRPKGARIGMHCFRRGVSSELLSERDSSQYCDSLAASWRFEGQLEHCGQILRAED